MCYYKINATLHSYALSAAALGFVRRIADVIALTHPAPTVWLCLMAASPITLPATLNTWARGSALAARDIEHVHSRFLLLDGCGLASFRDLHLARDDRVELVVFLTSVIDRIDLGRRAVVGWVGVDCARALLLQVDLLGFAPIEAIRVRLDLVLEHGLSHVVERTDSDVGGGVVLTHDGLEVPHCE